MRAGSRVFWATSASKLAGDSLKNQLPNERLSPEERWRPSARLFGYMQNGFTLVDGR
jgi:hypothetical protein